MTFDKADAHQTIDQTTVDQTTVDQTTVDKILADKIDSLKNCKLIFGTHRINQGISGSSCMVRFCDLSSEDMF